jgi:pilus assembly protein CpaB
MMLVLAIGFGLGAMVLTRQFLGDDSGKKDEETQEVLVAARDLREEELLKPDTVKSVRIAKSAVPAGSFTSPKDVEERWVNRALLESDVIVEKKLGPKGTPPGLVSNIPKGMRAFAIDVTEQTGVSGFVLPGHRVDVVRYEAAEKGVQHGETILQDILVLAAGLVFTRAEERAVTTRTVTLAVSPDQVDSLVAARAKGPLSLSLRGVNDHDVVARPQPKARVDESLEKRWKLQEERWKLQEEKRRELEQELLELKGSLAKKVVEPPPPPPAAPPPTPHFTTIYRGIDQPHRVRTDGTAVSDLAVRPEPIPKPDDPDRAGRLGFRPSRDGVTDDQAER